MSARAPRYVFHSTWRVSAPRHAVFEVLADLASYPAWWREVREVRRLDDLRAAVLIRSFLPYELRFSMEQTVRDPDAGALESRLVGDLEGVARWTLRESPEGTDCVFDEDVVTNKRILNIVEPVARPAFTFNHTRMMRSGERGLRAHLGRAIRP